MNTLTVDISLSDDGETQRENFAVTFGIRPWLDLLFGPRRAESDAAETFM